MRVAFLSGPGGVGKTTVGGQVLRLLPDHWVFFEVDRCQPTISPNPRFATIENERRMTRANLEAARCYVTAGFPTLVEMDVVDERRRRVREEVFRGIPALVIVLTARHDVAMQRIRERGTDIRWLAAFEATYEAVAWEHDSATATIDTSDRSPEQVAAEVAELIDAWTEVRATIHH